MFSLLLVPPVYIYYLWNHTNTPYAVLCDQNLMRVNDWLYFTTNTCLLQQPSAAGSSSIIIIIDQNAHTIYTCMVWLYGMYGMYVCMYISIRSSSTIVLSPVPKFRNTISPRQEKSVTAAAVPKRVEPEDILDRVFRNLIAKGWQNLRTWSSSGRDDRPSSIIGRGGRGDDTHRCAVVQGGSLSWHVSGPAAVAESSLHPSSGSNKLSVHLSLTLSLSLLCPRAGSAWN